jgi:hypothetical protein
MKKNRNTTTPATTADAASPSILTLDTLREMETGQRVELYVTTENRQRLGFLLQGKILHTLGTEGTELLRTAGIKPSSLANARRAEWVLRVFTEPDTDTLRNARFHVPGVDEPVEFSEALYNTLTLRQCELLQIGFTTMGTHRHRPTSRQMSDMLAKPDWDDHVECFLDCGTDLDGKAAREAEAAEALAAEARRREEMQRQIDEQAAQITAMQASGASALPPPPPVVNTAPAETTDDATPDNVVAFPAPTASDESETSAPSDEPAEATPEAEAAPEPATTQDEPETTDDAEDTDAVTHEEIASAVADATEGMENYSEDGPTVLTSCLDEIEGALNDGAVNQCSVEDLNSLLVRLDDITAALRTALVAKAAPQDELPAAQPKAKGGKRSKKAALAAA